MSGNKGGHPVVFTDERIDEIISDMEEYAEKEVLPSVAEFCYQQKIHKQRLSDIPRLADAKKRTISLKQEYQAMKAGIAGKIPTALAIFMLKNNGWSDKPEESTENNKLDKALEIIKGLTGDN